MKAKIEITAKEYKDIKSIKDDLDDAVYYIIQYYYGSNQGLVKSDLEQHHKEIFESINSVIDLLSRIEKCEPELKLN